MQMLHTDGYKFSMSEAGWPLRDETFYYTHRRNGPQLLPFSPSHEIARLLPRVEPEAVAYLAGHGYELGAASKQALGNSSAIRVVGLPKGSWFLPREPVFTVSGPSALVSWLEPLVLQWNFRIQIATLAATDPHQLARAVAYVTCEAERDLIRETLDAIDQPCPAITIDTEGYVARVRARAQELVRIVGDGARIFEVGLRAATSIEQHLLALAACHDAGIRRTSHVGGAAQLDMIPVGTMGHEHVQRYGSDRAAFAAMRDRWPSRSSYLLDTFDTLRSGIPAAFALIAQSPARGDSIRYDSGDKVAQYKEAARRAGAMGIRPVQIIEDGCDAEMTRTFEALREEVGWRPEEQFYGYGGYLVAQPMHSGLTRDRVSAVYKLSRSGDDATMKFGDEAGAGKESVPGRPVVFRRAQASAGPWGIIGQEGEVPPEGYVLASGISGPLAVAPDAGPPGYSVATEALMKTLRSAREGALA